MIPFGRDRLLFELPSPLYRNKGYSLSTRLVHVRDVYLTPPSASAPPHVEFSGRKAIATVDPILSVARVSCPSRARARASVCGCVRLYASVCVCVCMQYNIIIESRGETHKDKERCVVSRSRPILPRKSSFSSDC